MVINILGNSPPINWTEYWSIASIPAARLGTPRWGPRSGAGASVTPRSYFKISEPLTRFIVHNFFLQYAHFRAIQPRPQLILFLEVCHCNLPGCNFFKALDGNLNMLTIPGKVSDPSFGKDQFRVSDVWRAAAKMHWGIFWFLISLGECRQAQSFILANHERLVRLPWIKFEHPFCRWLDRKVARFCE